MPEKTGTKGTRREGKHSWNGCGSEAGRSERKRTAKLSTGTGVERMGNQAGENRESRRSESESGALRKPLRGGDRKQGKETQRLSSQNPKLKRPKGSENSGGQKAEGKHRSGVERKAQRRSEAKAEGKGEPGEAAAEIEAGGRRKEIADETNR